VMVMRTFFRGVPDSLRESAIIDGAGELRVLTRIIIPVAKPIIATIALFLVDTKSLIPLQYNLYRIISAMNFLQSDAASDGASVAKNVILPTEGVRLATTIITIGPIVLMYPFIQRFFVKGITIGAVKG